MKCLDARNRISCATKESLREWLNICVFFFFIDGRKMSVYNKSKKWKYTEDRKLRRNHRGMLKRQNVFDNLKRKLAKHSVELCVIWPDLG